MLRELIMMEKGRDCAPPYIGEAIELQGWRRANIERLDLMIKIAEIRRDVADRRLRRRAVIDGSEPIRSTIRRLRFLGYVDQTLTFSLLPFSPSSSSLLVLIVTRSTLHISSLPPLIIRGCCCC